MTAGDKIVIAVVLSISILSMLFVNKFLYGEKGTGVVIEVDGKPYAEYQFDQISTNKFIEIRSQYGYNKVELDKNRVRVVEADCPDKIDVKSGWIEKNNEMLVCLPNRVVVRIVGKNSELDGIAY